MTFHFVVIIKVYGVEIKNCTALFVYIAIIVTHISE